MAEQKKLKILNLIYHSLFKEFGPRNWWPAKTKFEIIAGAILTQNTNWANVVKAIGNLNTSNKLNPKALFEIKIKDLANLIRPAGYYNIKAKRLKNFINFLFKNYQGSIKKMFEENSRILRKKLLQINGIGPETADSILLYAGKKASFVVDAYTKRILVRHGLIDKKADYNSIQNLFETNIKKNVKIYNEYHALLVHLGKTFCRKIPKCSLCPINKIEKN